MQQRWPSRIWIVRHGESAGNVARDAAMSSGATHIDIAERDVDVPLSKLGEEQARAVGHWFADIPVSERPEVVLTSPYARATATARLMQREGAFANTIELGVDERLREKEFGVLDRLTREGIEKLYPEQAEFRRILGKFYHRPPAGESWCDVILRLRSALDTISLHCAGKRVLIVGHQVVVLCLRYLIENLTEKEILRIDAEGDVANCSVTEYAFDPDQVATGLPILVRYNYVAPVEREGTPVTSDPDANVAAR
jgi:2,3-bisphosphoglycerate-dependent phosphoglycerate mutase